MPKKIKTKRPIYEMVLLPPAEKGLTRIKNNRDQEAVAKKIDSLAKTPRPRGHKVLSDPARTHRVRVGTYRILYDVYDKNREVVILKVGPRRDVYRYLKSRK